MSNETWTDWLIQCDMLQDITRFPALDWLYYDCRIFAFGLLFYVARSKVGKRSYNHSIYSYVATRIVLSQLTSNTKARLRSVLSSSRSSSVCSIGSKSYSSSFRRMCGSCNRSRTP